MSNNKEEFYMCATKSIHGDFVGLWEIIAKQFIFVKLTFDTKPNKEEIKKLIDNKYKNKSLINMNPFHEDNYVILLETDNVMIITNKKYEYGRNFVVQDSIQPNRYFIGFCFKYGYISENITGLIVYFDENGMTTAGNIKILRKIVVNFDYRNGIINESSSFLCNQTLLFCQMHRDTQTLFLFANKLSWEDIVEYSVANHDTKLKVRLSLNSSGVKLISSIFIFLQNKNESYHLINLSSLRVKINNTNLKSSYDIKSNYLIMDCYNTTNLDDFINDYNITTNFFEQTEYSDGYPSHCPICKQLCMVATYNSNLVMGLGNAFCSKCLIRYSESNKCWVCCKIKSVIDNYSTNMCQNKLDNNYSCNLSHSDIMTLKVSSTVNKSLKYPYKENATVKMCDIV